MKNKLKPFMLLFFFAFILSGCKNDRQPADIGPKWAEIKPCFISYLKGSFECDKKAAQYDSQLRSCLAQCDADFQNAVSALKPGPDALKGLANLNTIRTACQKHCYEVHDAQMEEITKCREDALNAIQGCLDLIKP